MKSNEKEFKRKLTQLRQIIKRRLRRLKTNTQQIVMTLLKMSLITTINLKMKIWRNLKKNSKKSVKKQKKGLSAFQEQILNLQAKQIDAIKESEDRQHEMMKYFMDEQKKSDEIE